MAVIGSKEWSDALVQQSIYGTSGAQPGNPNFIGPVQPAQPGSPEFIGPVQPAQPGDYNFIGPVQTTAAGNILTDSQETEHPLIGDPAWLANDCICRGGLWRAPNCIPGVPTGKYFDLTTRGCLPIPGYKPPQLASGCEWRGVNVCLVGGILLGVLALAALMKKA